MVEAIRTGYRMIDTAHLYRNHQQVGEGVRQALAEGILERREKIGLTTKIWKNQFKKTEEAVMKALAELQVDYLDVVLLHQNSAGAAEAWAVLARLKDSGLIKTIGVSNFTIQQIEALGEPRPSINQIEISPYRFGRGIRRLVDYCHQRGILIEAHSPMGKGELLTKYQATPEFLLHWQFSHGFSVVCCSAKPSHIQENFSIWSRCQSGEFSFPLREMAEVEEFLTHPQYSYPEE